MSSSPSYRFIIIDDSITSCTHLRVLLEENGHQVVGETTDGREALKLYRQNTPDMVTMDLNMNQKRGIEAMREILDFDPEARIIVVTALDRNLVRYECTHIKRYQIAPKPIRWADLSSALEFFFPITGNSSTP